MRKLKKTTIIIAVITILVMGIIPLIACYDEEEGGIRIPPPWAWIEFNSNGGSQVPTQRIDYPEQRVIRPVDPQKHGYIFVDWYTDSTFSELFDFDTPIGIGNSTTLFARWKKI